LAPICFAEDLPLGGVVDGALDEPVAVADGSGREQDAFGVPAVDDVAEPAVDLADDVHRALMTRWLRGDARRQDDGVPGWATGVSRDVRVYAR
jgi:hypothetical protein